jgi:peroxiredoxin
MPSVETLPAVRGRLRDCELPTPEGRTVRFSDFRGRRNLVVLLGATRLLSDLATRSSELSYEEAQVLVVSPRPVESPFLVLLDPEKKVHDALGASESAPAVYITDRYGEIYATYRVSEGQQLPTADEVLRWLEFINSQCPECEAPVWWA